MRPCSEPVLATLRRRFGDGAGSRQRGGGRSWAGRRTCSKGRPRPAPVVVLTALDGTGALSLEYGWRRAASARSSLRGELGCPPASAVLLFFAREFPPAIDDARLGSCRKGGGTSGWASGDLEKIISLRSVGRRDGRQLTCCTRKPVHGSVPGRAQCWGELTGRALGGRTRDGASRELQSKHNGTASVSTRIDGAKRPKHGEKLT